jgi:NAD(P)H-dependent glutamate synthase small subunit
MSKADGFLRFGRQDPHKKPPVERVRNFREFEELLPPDELNRQANRCMDCGIPFCHTFGCPVQNRIPEWIDAVYRNRWRRASELLHATDNFPEITGRVCPAPCEAACTLAINQPAVTIRHIELQIVERAFAEGWLPPEPAASPTDKRVAVIGSGPAGLVVAQQLARAGHTVSVFEKDDRLGGLLRYGIPDFKLEKSVLNRRLEQMRAEGVIFETGVDVGADLSARYLRRSFDAIVLTMGAGAARDLEAPGRELRGIQFALPFLTLQNRRCADDATAADPALSAAGKHVVVIGGGDTGADCIGVSNRQGAASVTQLEILPEPPDQRPLDNPWPTWPRVKRSSAAHDEGCRRLWGVTTKAFLGRGGKVAGLRCAKVAWAADGKKFHEVRGSEFELPADLVLLAMGFTHVAHGPIIADLGVEVDGRGNLRVDERMMTTQPGVFAAGDAVEGASLVVRAFHSARVAAECVDRDLRERGDSRD